MKITKWKINGEQDINESQNQIVHPDKLLPASDQLLPWLEQSTSSTYITVGPYLAKFRLFWQNFYKAFNRFSG